MFSIGTLHDQYTEVVHILVFSIGTHGQLVSILRYGTYVQYRYGTWSVGQLKYGTNVFGETMIALADSSNIQPSMIGRMLILLNISLITFCYAID